MLSKGGQALLPTPGDDNNGETGGNANNSNPGPPGPVRFYNSAPPANTGGGPISLFDLGDIKPVGELQQKIMEHERWDFNQVLEKVIVLKVFCICFEQRFADEF